MLFSLKLFYLCRVCLGRSLCGYSPVGVWEREMTLIPGNLIVLITGYILLGKLLNLRGLRLFSFHFRGFKALSAPTVCSQAPSGGGSHGVTELC